MTRDNLNISQSRIGHEIFRLCSQHLAKSGRSRKIFRFQDSEISLVLGRRLPGVELRKNQRPRTSRRGTGNPESQMQSRQSETARETGARETEVKNQQQPQRRQFVSVRTLVSQSAPPALVISRFQVTSMILADLRVRLLGCSYADWQCIQGLMRLAEINKEAGQHGSAVRDKPRLPRHGEDSEPTLKGA